MFSRVDSVGDGATICKTRRAVFHTAAGRLATEPAPTGFFVQRCHLARGSPFPALTFYLSCLSTFQLSTALRPPHVHSHSDLQFVPGHATLPHETNTRTARPVRPSRKKAASLGRPAAQSVRRLQSPALDAGGLRAAGRHKRRCTVCHHPERDLIEQEFLRWSSPFEISEAFGLKDPSAIYRHAHALGLFERRRLNVRCVSGQLLEFAEMVKPTANSVLQALRAFTRITSGGEWIEPPKRVIVTNTVKRTSTRRPRRRSQKAGQLRTLPANVTSPEWLMTSDLKGLSVTNFTRSPARTRHKSNGTARTQKKLAQQIIFARQLITNARRRRRNLVKQLKRNGFASLIASHKIEVPESHIAENAALKNSYSQIKGGLRFHAPA